MPRAYLIKPDLLSYWIGAIFFFVFCSSAVLATQTQVADPVLSVAAGTSGSNVTVTVTDSTSGAVIYYTTNGTSPTTSSSSISPGGTILVNLNTNLEVQAYQGSNNPSNVVTATYAANGLITSGGQHALALKGDGTVWAWGNNTQGQLGIGGTGSSSPPIKLSLTGTAPIAGITSTRMAFDNGLPVAWEIKYFGQTGNNPNSSPDGNGLTLLQDYQQGNDPTNYYSQNGTIITPTLTIVSGNGQSSTSIFFSAPLVVKITNSSGTALVNAPVTFTIISFPSGSNPKIYQQGGSTSSGPLTLLTDNTGQASVFLSTTGSFGPITVRATTGTATPVTFFESFVMGGTE